MSDDHRTIFQLLNEAAGALREAADHPSIRDDHAMGLPADAWRHFDNPFGMLLRSAQLVISAAQMLDEHSAKIERENAERFPDNVIRLPQGLNRTKQGDNDDQC